MSPTFLSRTPLPYCSRNDNSLAEFCLSNININYQTLIIIIFFSLASSLTASSSSRTVAAASSNTCHDTIPTSRTPTPSCHNQPPQEPFHARWPQGRPKPPLPTTSNAQGMNLTPKVLGASSARLESVKGSCWLGGSPRCLQTYLCAAAPTFLSPR